MKIKIGLDNHAAIQAALDAINGKATAHTICASATILDMVTDLELKLERSGLAKGERGGVIVRHAPAGPSASAYKYAATSTRVTLLRGSTHWYLTNVERVDIWPKQKELMEITITPQQAAAIQAAALKPYSVAA